MKQVNGMVRCRFCDIPFEPKRKHGAYCGQYCRTALWSLLNRRKRTESGLIEVEINGKRRIFTQEAR